MEAKERFLFFIFRINKDRKIALSLFENIRQNVRCGKRNKTFTLKKKYIEKDIINKPNSTQFSTIRKNRYTMTSFSLLNNKALPVGVILHCCIIQQKYILRQCFDINVDKGKTGMLWLSQNFLLYKSTILI